MLRFPPIFVLALLTCVSCSPPALSDSMHVDRGIIGGTETDGWPAVGAYLIDGGYGGLCTATLVHPEVLLTAAHCADGAGDWDLWNTSSFAWDYDPDTTYEIAEAHIHPRYEVGDKAYFHDIAVLILEEPITDIQPIPVNTELFDADWRERWLDYIGYGNNTTYHGEGSGTKRETEIQISDYYLEFFYHYTDGTNTCAGDSGGPAVVELDGNLYVAGVTSSVWGTNDPCDGGGIDMRVDHELDFLAEFFDPYETPYPAGDDDDSADDSGVDVVQVEDEDEPSAACQFRGNGTAGYGSWLGLFLLAAALGRRRR